MVVDIWRVQLLDSESATQIAERHTPAMSLQTMVENPVRDAAVVLEARVPDAYLGDVVAAGQVSPSLLSACSRMTGRQG
jgi:hypothetical protein